MTPSLTYAAACRHPDLFGPWFDGDSWAAWRVVDKALFGEPLDAAELAVFRELSGSDSPPTAPVLEAWLAFGRRAGKDVKAASIAAYLATIGVELYDLRRYLARGERGVVQLLAVDRDQTQVCLNYIRAFFEQPVLRAMLKKPPTSDSIELVNDVVIEVTTNDRRRVRGRTVIAAVLDEVAHWLSSEQSANPDEEVYKAIRPAMATIPHAMLIGISSPYARRGLLWRKHQELWARPGTAMFLRAPTWTMNPTLPRDHPVIADAYAADPSWAAAEYGAEFRSDLEAFVSRDAVEACVEAGCIERPPVRGTLYTAFCDPSGGRSDSMTLGVAHWDSSSRVVLDCLRERRPPFSPSDVVEEFCELLNSYGVRRLTGDRYGGEWVTDAFREHGVKYEPASKAKTDIYRDALSSLNSGRFSLLDLPRLTSQLVSLERRVARGGRDSIDHAPGAHDDLANAAMGALVAVVGDSARRYTEAMMRNVRGSANKDDPRWENGMRLLGFGAAMITGRGTPQR